MPVFPLIRKRFVSIRTLREIFTGIEASVFILIFIARISKINLLILFVMTAWAEKSFPSGAYRVEIALPVPEEG
jgi:hypothetical protein